MSPVSVVQLSDTHFREDDAPPEGGFAYDTDAAFDAVLPQVTALGPDLIAVTGDVADHGRPAQYRKAADAFARLGVPVNACPGNHDFVDPFTAGIGRAGVGTSRVVEVGPWAFVFCDSSAGLMRLDADGVPTDPEGETRLHNNGALGAREAAVVRRLCAEVTAEHVFLWLHHPPAPPLPLCHDEAYAAEWRALLDDLPTVRGMAGGHTHVPDAYTFEGVPVFVAPSFKNNFSLDPQSWLPPGFRSYRFDDDGSVTSTLHFAPDDPERWPRRPFGRTLRSLFDGEITHAELAAIVAARAAGAS
ncbi:MAG: metallophosphoesterase [Actinomycetota bacterium]